MPDNRPVIFYDGYCNLCTWSVRFVIKRDKGQKFRFEPLPPGQGGNVLSSVPIDKQRIGSIVYLENEKIYLRSTAVLRILKRLGGIWSSAYVLIIIPAFIRDRVYDVVAACRYRWFGRRDSCMIIPPDRNADISS